MTTAASTPPEHVATDPAAPATIRATAGAGGREDARHLVPAWRPGLRAAVLSVCGALVVGAALLVSTTVADHVRAVAVDEAVRSTESVVRGYIDPVADEALAAPSGPEGAAIDTALERLVAAGKILRIKVWQPDGTVAFSDLPALRGKTFEVEPDLAEVLEGTTETEFTDGDHPENAFERGLAPRLLSIYLPIRSSADGPVVGAYEIYEDAAPIEAAIDRAHRDVLLIVGAMAVGLLIVLLLAFSGTSRRLTLQNRRLREQAVTEQLLAADLRASQERFRSLVQNSVDVSLIVRPDRTIDYESPAVERVLGRRPGATVGHDLLDLVHPDDRPFAGELLVEVARTPGAQVSGDFRMAYVDGSWRAVEAVARNLADDPAVAGIVVNFRDVTVRKVLEEELRHQAFHDSLTGLANRALFIDRLEHALARARLGRPSLVVLFVDLDDFKNVNDSLGHGEGDRLVVAVADRLRASLRAGDTIARMGGDEFAILLEDPADTADPIAVAERLRAVLREPFDGIARGTSVRASIGIARAGAGATGGLGGTASGAAAGGGASTAEELLRDADVAMYAAKANGKDRVEVFEPRMHAAALDRMALTVDLEGALDRGELFLLYQPVIDLASGRMVGVEALLRWRHPTRGIVGPLDFIPAAEASGQIVPIGRWVLDATCRQLIAWDADVSTSGFRASVNVAARQIVEPGFVDEVAAILGSTGVPASRLVLEFTESALMQETDATLATLRRLKALGVALAIDDFGTGYSSLSYLRLFPVDVLKIDRSFVANLSKGNGERALMDSILRLSRTLHLQTVAEGIEDATQLEDLRRLGAAFGQGYLFARPTDAASIASMLARQRGADLGGAGQGEEQVA